MSFKTSSLSVVVLALAAPVLFHYGPSFIKQHEKKVLNPTSVGKNDFEVVKENAAPAFEPSKLPAAVPVAAPAKSRNTIKKKNTRVQSSQRELRRVNSLSGQPLPEAPALKPAAKDTYASGSGEANNATARKESPTMSAQERKFMGKDRNFSDPMKDRWVNDVSGQNARVSFEKFRHGDNCQLAGTCERAPAPNDVSLAGVVVDSDQLRRPVDSMLDGRVKRGHYINKTPAVYLK